MAITGSLGLASFACAGQPEDAAGDAYSGVHSAFGEKDALRERAALPLTSSGTPMETLDGAQSFTAQLMAPSSEVYLTLLAQPAATGDLQLVRLAQDTDLDGAPDHDYTVPFFVSGICANGVIGCDPGTWTSCTYHRWTADSGGRVGLELVDVTALGGCYCINRDCGSNLAWVNLPLLLRDLGGGAVGAAQSARSDVSVSEVAIDGPSITYYGQRVSRAGSEPVTGLSQAGYYRNPSAVESDAGAELLDQSGDPGSLYSQTLATWEQAGGSRRQVPCAIRREVGFESLTLSDIVVPGGGTGEVRPCPGVPGGCVEIVLGREGNNYWSGNCTVYEEDYTVVVKRPDAVERATLVYTTWDDYMQVWIGGDKVWSGPDGNFPPETPGPCELATSWRENLDLDMTDHFRIDGPVETKIRVSVSGKGEGYAHVRLEVDTECSVTESTADTCRTLEGDPECGLLREAVDGVITVDRGLPTGLTPLPGTRTVSGAGGCSEAVTRPWWEKERIYLCEEAAGFDFSDARERLTAIDESATFAGGTLGFTDRRRTESGAWVTETGAIEVNLAPAPGVCEAACKTRVPRLNTQVGASGHVEERRLSVDGHDLYYRVCTPEGTCPVAEPGEEILIDCQCIDEFAEAASILLSLKEAQEDVTCTDGVRK